MSGSAWRFEGMGVESESLIGTDWIVPNARERGERDMAQVDGRELWLVFKLGYFLSIYLPSYLGSQCS